MLRLQVLLPELFCCREIGDGFGAIVNALKYSFANASGNLFTRGQLETIVRVLSTLSNEPFLRFETAVDLISDLEDSGLDVDPPVIAELLANDVESVS